MQINKSIRILTFQKKIIILSEEETFYLEIKLERLPYTVKSTVKLTASPL